jgi:hypothetical protein
VFFVVEKLRLQPVENINLFKSGEWFFKTIESVNFLGPEQQLNRNLTSQQAWKRVLMTPYPPRAKSWNSLVAWRQYGLKKLQYNILYIFVNNILA